MNCEGFLYLVKNVPIDKTTAGQREASWKHLKGCENCQQFMGTVLLTADDDPRATMIDKLADDDWREFG